MIGAQYSETTMHKLDSLLRGNRLLQHGGFFISLKAKTILTLLLQAEEPQAVSTHNLGYTYGELHKVVSVICKCASLAFLSMISMYPAISWDICSPSVVWTE